MIDLFKLTTHDMLVFSLIFFRMSSLIITMPFFGGNQIPRKIRYSFVLCLTFLMYQTIDGSSIPFPGHFFEYVVLITKELGIGIIIGFIASIAFFAVQLGGEIIAVQMGLTMSQDIDPLSASMIPTLGQFLTLLIMVVFLAFDGHHLILKVFMDSFRTVPVSQIHYSGEVFSFILTSFNTLFVIGMRIAMPAMMLIFSLTMALAFMARLVPQMNVFVLSLPINISAGLTITIICIPLIIALFHSTFATVIDNMYRLLSGLS